MIFETIPPCDKGQNHRVLIQFLPGTPDLDFDVTKITCQECGETWITRTKGLSLDSITSELMAVPGLEV